MAASETPAYILRGERHAEERLNSQHDFSRRSLGHLYHPDLGDLSSCRRILDCATGSGAWAKDIAEGAKGLRLGEEVRLHPDCRIDMCDVSDEALPKMLPRGSDFFFHDVLDPFPNGRRSTYDLIHQRLLVGGLKPEQWVPALKNLKDGLVPGGQIALCEPGVSFVSPQDAPCTVQANALIRKLVAAAEYSLDLADALPGLLAEAGFVDIRAYPCHWGYGPESDHLHPGFPKAGLEHLKSLFDPDTGSTMLGAKPLCGRKGLPRYEKAAKVMRAWLREVETVSVKQKVVLVVAQKPA